MELQFAVIDLIREMTGDIAFNLRRPRHASTTRHPSPNFDATEYEALRLHLERIIFFQKSQSPHWDDSQDLDDFQQLLIDANLRRRYHFDLLAQEGPGERPSQVPTQFSEYESFPVFSSSTDEGLAFDLPTKPWQWWRPTFGSSIKLPQPPPADEHGNTTCPLCFRSYPSKECNSHSYWRNHILHDLHPFTCFSCSPEPVIFSRYDAWAVHQAEAHNDRTACPIACPLFREDDIRSASFLDHVRKAHSESSAAPDTSEVNEGIWDKLQSCPVCSFSAPAKSERLIKHVIEHTMRFSLHALPPSFAPYAFASECSARTAD
ncbi:unnamed protein product [Clonostachys rosea]|uniref:C2H2-type domain-containing protein n=1 Tax=Bionectria ochroleuca TaxID=29856 RepID=A0ABY6U227_BIOOC|nr:unnamed protein product [Clonostachys rosea]